MLSALRRPRSPRVLAGSALVTLLMLWVIVPSGAVVRLTGSGLGCPDWPLCDGGVVPEQTGHQLIEYTNRLLSGLVVAVAVVNWWIATRVPSERRGPRRWALGAALVSAAQAPMGAITVLSGLHPLAVGSHFLLSMIALACGTLCYLAARDLRDGRARAWDRRRGPLAGLVAVAAGTLLVTGVTVTAAGPHPGDSREVKRLGNLLLAAQVHVRAAVVFTCLAVVLIAWLWRERGAGPLARPLSLAALPLIALQIGLGEYQYRHGMPWEVVIFHVTVAGLVWAVIVGMCREAARPLAAEGYRSRDALVWQGTQRTASGTARSRPSGMAPPQSTHTP